MSLTLLSIVTHPYCSHHSFIRHDMHARLQAAVVPSARVRVKSPRLSRPPFHNNISNRTHYIASTGTLGTPPTRLWVLFTTTRPSTVLHNKPPFISITFRLTNDDAGLPVSSSSTVAACALRGYPPENICTHAVSFRRLKVSLPPTAAVTSDKTSACYPVLLRVCETANTGPGEQLS